MTALVGERTEAPMMCDAEVDLDEALWQAWKTLELPEGFHAEIVEGFIEVSPTGRSRHGIVFNRLRRRVEKFLEGSEWLAYQDMNVLHDKKILMPDVFIGPDDLEAALDEDGIGVSAESVVLVAEVVPPGRDATERGRVRKRRAYARAGIPVYVLIDDHDGHGTVTVLTSPSRKEAVYAAETRVPYGTAVEIPEGPAKGFAITEEITGEPSA
ncbi:Uma2 family endonuclease [Streptomyces zingiberis]|uniref:Uma2 family endonuclease n=1 Tax=Streptomyces zingiberis TaxID=2053010 RepID=A0ABX1BVU0_9ACTN|nr:Uma2 family endonuclease [Streptomyces zingiberis]NJP99378.1 Uma2 family endonuclease [Streptomyces zingiberis]